MGNELSREIFIHSGGAGRHLFRNFTAKSKKSKKEKERRGKKKEKMLATFAFPWYPVQNLKAVCTLAEYVIVSEFQEVSYEAI